MGKSSTKEKENRQMRNIDLNLANRVSGFAIQEDQSLQHGGESKKLPRCLSCVVLKTGCYVVKGFGSFPFRKEKRW